MSGLSDDLRTMTPDPDDKPLMIEVDEQTRTDNPQVTCQTLVEEFGEHYQQRILPRLPKERAIEHAKAWAEIHRSVLVYWEQTKRNGYDPGTLRGWETVAAMVDISQNMATMADEVVDRNEDK